MLLLQTSAIIMNSLQMLVIPFAGCAHVALHPWPLPPTDRFLADRSWLCPLAAYRTAMSCWQKLGRQNEWELASTASVHASPLRPSRPDGRAAETQRSTCNGEMGMLGRLAPCTIGAAVEAPEKAFLSQRRRPLPSCLAAKPPRGRRHLERVVRGLA